MSREKWGNTALSVKNSVYEALQIINSSGLRSAVVVDGDDSLLGIVTDGDIRRGLLSGVALQDSVELVMNAKPFVASQTDSKRALIAAMRKHAILSMPVVDQQGKLLRLATIAEESLPDAIDSPVFLMAGGFGTRLRPLTDSIPKPMLTVGEKPLLELLIEQFKSQGFSTFYISTHYLPEIISSHFGDGTSLGVSIQYVHEEKPLGTGGALSLLPHDEIDKPIVVVNGDVLTAVKFNRLLENHKQSGAVATMGVREYDYQIPYGVINGEDGRVVSMDEKPTFRHFINTGIYVLEPKVLESLASADRIDMPDVLNQCIERGDNVNMFPIHEYWLDIGRMDDYQRAQVDVHGVINE